MLTFVICPRRTNSNLVIIVVDVEIDIMKHVMRFHVISDECVHGGREKLNDFTLPAPNLTFVCNMAAATEMST